MSFQCHQTTTPEIGAVARATGHQGFGPQNLRNNGFNWMSIKKVFFVFHLYFISEIDVKFICISFVIETFRFQFRFQFVTHFCFFLFFALGYSSCGSLFFALCWTHKMREGCGVHFVPGERPK